MVESMKVLPSIPRYGLTKAGYTIEVVPESPRQLIRFHSSARSFERKGIAQQRIESVMTLAKQEN